MFVDQQKLNEIWDGVILFIFTVRALAPQAEGWVFESKSRQTNVVKTDCDSSTAKRSAIGVCVTGTRGGPI